MTTITIDVNQGVIDASIEDLKKVPYLISTRCPVVRAINTHLRPGLFARTRLNFRVSIYEGNPARLHEAELLSDFELPPKAELFINLFDRRANYAPISFPLVIDESLLRQ